MDTLNSSGSPNNTIQVNIPGEKRPASIWNQSLDKLLLSAWDNRGSLGSFLSLTGGSILYCLSALSIIYGITRIIGPLLAKSSILADIYPCIVVLNIYEIALLAVLVLIVVWKNVTDDAISLVILVGIFLIGTGMTLGVVAASGPTICLWTGVICTILGLVKLYVMRRLVSFRLGVLSFVGISLILAWNFLTPSLMAGPMIAKTATDEIRRNHWLIGWLVMLTGAAIVIVEAARTRPIEDKDTPFLRTPAMVWIFTLVLLTAVSYHQYGIAYMFAVDYVFGDFIPLIAVGSILMLQLIRCSGKHPLRTEIVISVIPLFLTIFAAANKKFISGPAASLEIFWYPPVFLALIAIVFTCLARYHKQKYYSYIALIYALGVLLTIGYSPEKTQPLNWQLCGAGIITVLLALGVIHKSAALCFSAILALAFGLCMTDWFQTLAQKYNMTLIGAAAGVFGLGNFLICLVFGSKMPRVITLIASLAIAGFLFDFLPKGLGWTDLSVTGAIAVISIMFWLRPRDLIAAVFSWLPICPKVYLLARDLSSWGFVLLSFVLLFVGAFVSIFIKGRKPKFEPLSAQSQDSGTSS
ncbi:MAG: hypothetical protein JW749_07320 [Sedimentisphaerales bacterium]|nr:hypothetical protein [Sedimentisphaerales bacterium]